MEHKLAKLLALLLAAALLTACMAGCGATPEQPANTDSQTKNAPADTAPTDSEITLTFWHTYGDTEEAQFLNVVRRSGKPRIRTSRSKRSVRTAASSTR